MSIWKISGNCWQVSFVSTYRGGALPIVANATGEMSMPEQGWHRLGCSEQGIQVFNWSVSSFRGRFCSKWDPISQALRGCFRLNLDRSGLGGRLR